MKKYLALIFLAAFSLLFFIEISEPAEEQQEPSAKQEVAQRDDEAEEGKSTGEYYIAPGDVVEVSVWQNDDLHRNVRVDPGGMISFPFVGRLQAAGLSMGQLEEKIKQGLSQYIRYPEVNLSLLETAGNKVIVLGEVGGKGIYTYRGSLTLIEAIALSGGFSEKARIDSIMIVRGNLIEYPEVIRINLAQFMGKGTPNPNIVLKPNDIIYVPRSYIHNWNKFLENIRSSIDTFYTILNVRDEVLKSIVGRRLKY